MTPARPALRLEPLEARTTPARIGFLDPSFGTAGRVVTSFDLGGDNIDAANHVALQPDGKIVAVGFIQRGATDYDFGIARYNPNGTLDTTFDGDGRRTVAFDLGGGNNDRASNVVIQPDGKIVVVGGVQRGTTDYDFGVARLLPDGTLDTTFDGDGRRTVAFDLGGGNEDKATAVDLQPDGKIVLGGFVQRGTTNYDFGAVRLLPNGDLDASFDGDGKRTVAFDIGGGNDDKPYALDIQPDGRIVLGGSASVTSFDYDMAVARLNADGSPDTSFSGDGKKTVAIDRGGGQADKANDIALQPDGKIVLAGFAEIGFGDYDFAAARLNADGSADTSFQGTGWVVVPFNLGGGNGDFASDVTLQPDGRIVMAGAAQLATGTDAGVVRLLPDGALDPAFGGTGKLAVALNPAGGTDDQAQGVVIQPDGRIVIAGQVQGGAVYDFAVARITGSVGLPNVLAVGGDPTGRVPMYAADNYTTYGTTPLTTLTPMGGAMVNSAAADVDGDGTPDLVSGAAAGGDRVVVQSGRDGSTLASFSAFGGYGGGVFVAAGDLTGDGRAEVVVSPVLGGIGPRVAVFAGASLVGGTGSPAKLADFNGIADALTGAADNSPGTIQLVGARVAVGDVNGDGTPDLAVAAGTGGGPRVTIWDGRNVAAAPTAGTPAAPPLANAFVFEDSQRDGAFVSLGDVTGDGQADLVAGGGPNGGPRVRIGDMAAILAAKNFGKFDDQLGVVKSNFFAGDPAARGGVRVAARDVDGDGTADLVTGSGTGLRSQLQLFRGARLVTLTGGVQAGDQVEDPFGAVLADGVFVG